MSDATSPRIKNSLSKADPKVVEHYAKVKLEKLEGSSLADKIERLIKIVGPPDELLEATWACLRNCMKTRKFPNDDVNEVTKSSIIERLLAEINAWFQRKFHITTIEELELQRESPISWLEFTGRINYAIVRTEGSALYYFYVVECKARNALDGVKEAVMYLREIQSRNPDRETYYAIVTTAEQWHLVKLNKRGFSVSKVQRLLFGLMSEPGEIMPVEETFEEPRKNPEVETKKDYWKANCATLVKVIFTIMDKELSRIYPQD